MKRSFVLFCALMAGALSFSSCNKDLKDDLNELKRELGVDAPIVITTTFTDFSNVERKVTANLKYKESNSYSNGLLKNTDGTYSVSLGRYESPVGDQSVELRFDYDATAKKILYKSFRHYWEDMDHSRGELDVTEYDEPETGLTFDVNIKSIDVQTGAIDLEVKITGTKEFSTNNPYDVPNRNSAFTSGFTFNGKLATYTWGEGEQPL